MARIQRATFVVFLAVFSARAQDPCATPQNKIGACIDLRECTALLSILVRERPPSQQTIAHLRSLQCGFIGMYPKVCCEQARETTPTTTTTTTTTTTERLREPTDLIVTPQLTNNTVPPNVTDHPNLRLLNHDICGPVTQQKIFGGNRTGVFDYPWMALLAYNTGRRDPDFHCGGSIVSKRYILTAAHCVTSLPEGWSLVSVRVGEHDLSTERDCDKDEDGQEVSCAEKYQDFGIEDVQFHAGYNKADLHDDIALIRLNGDIDFQPASVKPICLPFGSAAKLAQKKVTVTGWGATEYGPRSQELLHVKLSPVSNEECAEAYKHFLTEITPKQMCAGGKRMMDSCLGDSGGPLQAAGIYNESSLRYIQYGIVSFGTKTCGTEGFPGVYTRLTFYVDWILNNMRD